MVRNIQHLPQEYGTLLERHIHSLLVQATSLRHADLGIFSKLSCFILDDKQGSKYGKGIPACQAQRDKQENDMPVATIDSPGAISERESLTSAPDLTSSILCKSQ